MKNLLANGSEEKQTKEFMRFGQFVSWTTLVAFGFGGVEVLAFVLFRNYQIGAAGAVTFGYGFCLVVARELLRRGQMKMAVIVSCSSLLVGIVVIALILPIAIPALTILPLVVVALALSYLQGQEIRLLILASWSVGIFIVVLGEVLVPQAEIPIWFSVSFRISSIVTALGLAFLLMWQFTSRLNDTLSQTRAINTELQNEVNERKRAQEKLSESEERYRRFFENMHETFIIQEIVVDEAGKPIDLRYLDLNPAAEQILGKTRNEIVGLTRSQLSGRSDSEGVEMASQVASTGKPFHMVRYSPGFGGWFESFTYSLGSGVVATLSLDITERKKAEEALRESQVRLNGIIASAMDAIISVDPEQSVVLFNTAAEKMFGYSAAEAIGQPLERLIPERFRATHREHIHTFGETGVTNRAMNALGVIFGLHANGEEFPIEASISQIAIDGKKLYTVILRDITERKQAEEALSQSQENFAKAFNSNPAAIAITRLTDGKFLNVNPAYLRIMEYEPDELLEHTAAEKNIYAYPEERTQLIQKLREEGSVQNYELRVRVKSGEIRNIILSMQPILYNEEECILSVFVDISERKKMEQELQRSNNELEQFAYVASHDLQEPLRAVAGMVQLLGQRYKGKLDERADEYIGHAVEASGRMQSLINDLLDYSRVGRLAKPFTLTNLERSLDTALANLQLAVQESGAQITYDPLPTLMVDASQLTQVFQNLIGNAIKFRGERSLQIHVSASQVENEWRIGIHDNGIGIEPQYFERIFLIFQRLHTRREYAGTGIGLSLCKKIVERHHGQIWVESQPGQGSTFYFKIPERQT